MSEILLSNYLGRKLNNLEETKKIGQRIKSFWADIGQNFFFFRAIIWAVNNKYTCEQKIWAVNNFLKVEIWAENQNTFEEIFGQWIKYFFELWGWGKNKKVGAVVVWADENNTNKILLRAFKKISEDWVVGTTGQRAKDHFWALGCWPTRAASKKITFELWLGSTWEFCF